jgi:hypothetical protein
MDGTGLLFYNARYYDPVLARFVSPDTVVPGAANGSLDGIALKPLTVGFVEPGFVAQLNAENQYGPWFTLSDRERQQLGSPMGPMNPQSLNRYAYGLNNPVKYTDPTGHWAISLGITISGGSGFGGLMGVGVTFDGQGNIAIYRTTTELSQQGLPKAVIAGSSAGIGFSLAALVDTPTSTPTVDDMAGRGFMAGFNLPTSYPPLGVDVDYVAAIDSEGQPTAQGIGVGAGPGVGLDGHMIVTTTTLHGKNLPQRILSEIDQRMVSSQYSRGGHPHGLR